MWRKRSTSMRWCGTRARSTSDGFAVEKIHHSGFHRILGADHQEPVVADQLLQDVRAVPQLADRSGDVGPHRLSHQRLPVVPQLGPQQRLGRGPDAIDDRPQVAGLIFQGPLQLFESRPHGAALRVPQHHHQPGAEAGGGELDAAHPGGRHDVAGDANDEQIAQPLIEDDLGGHPRVRATEDDGEGLLLLRQLERPRRRGLAADAGDEAPVAVAQMLDGFLGRSHRPKGRRGWVDWISRLTMASSERGSLHRAHRPPPVRVKAGRRREAGRRAMNRCRC